MFWNMLFLIFHVILIGKVLINTKKYGFLFYVLNIIFVIIGTTDKIIGFD